MGNSLLRDKLGTSDCTGNLPLKKDQTDQNITGPNSDIRDTKSKLKKQCVTHWCGLKSKTFLRKVTALRILAGLARVVRRQIGNTVLGGCNRRPLEKITAFKFCLFGAAPSRESSLFIKQVRLLYCDQLKLQYTYVFHTYFIFIFRRFSLFCYI